MSSGHAHHAIHLVACFQGDLRVRTDKRWRRAHGVITAPDVPHALDASGADILLVFIDPESDVGRALLHGWRKPLRLLHEGEAATLLEGASPERIMGPHGVAWLRRLVELLSENALDPRPPLHPRVRRLIRHLPAVPPRDRSLAALADAVQLSPSRLMHAFTASVGVPLRRYLLWLRLQSAAAAIVGGAPLTEAALHAGFSDAAHMTRTFRRMFGMPPSRLRPASS